MLIYQVWEAIKTQADLCAVSQGTQFWRQRTVMTLHSSYSWDRMETLLTVSSRRSQKLLSITWTLLSAYKEPQPLWQNLDSCHLMSSLSSQQILDLTFVDKKPETPQTSRCWWVQECESLSETFFFLFLIWNKFKLKSPVRSEVGICYIATFLHIHIHTRLGMCLKYDFKCEESILDSNDLIKNTALGPFLQDVPLGSFLAVYQILYKSYMVQSTYSRMCTYTFIKMYIFI